MHPQTTSTHLTAELETSCAGKFAESSRHADRRHARRLPLLAQFLIASLLTSGCSSEVSKPVVELAATRQRPQVFVSSLFLRDTVKALAGDSVDILFPFNETPSTDWKPSAQQAKQLQSADLILLSGASYEPWRGKLSLPRSRLVDTSAAYADQLMSLDNVKSHQHGPRGAAEQGEAAWATWLDPQLAMAQVAAVQAALLKLIPEQSQQLQAGVDLQVQQLQVLDDALSSLASATPAVVAVSDSPQCCYVVRRLNWKLLPVLVDPDSDDLEALKKMLTDSEAGFLLRTSPDDVETSSPLQSVAAESGVRMLRLDLCQHSINGEADTLQRMTENLHRLQEVVRQSEPQLDD